MAAITLLSGLGGVVRMSSQHDEVIVSALADGNAKAGWCVGIEGTDGTVDAVDIDGSIDNFIGICLPRYDTDVDTAFTSADVIDIVVPISGHSYNVRIEDPSATLEEGHAMIWGDDPGSLQKGSTLETQGTVAVIAERVITGTTFATVRWL